MYAESADAAQLLLNAGAGIDHVDSMGWSALVHAAHGALAELVQLLLCNGADLEVKPWYDGRQMSLGDFIDCRCEFYEKNASTLRQPQAADALQALKNVRELIRQHTRT